MSKIKNTVIRLTPLCFKIALLLCSFFSPSAVFAENNIRYWFDAQFETHLTDRLKFKGEEELWYNDDRLYLQETIFLLEFDAFDWLSIGVGDRFVDEKKMKNGKRQWCYEHRPTLDLTFKHELEGFRFDMRNRLEYRDKEDTRRNYLRYRGRFRVRTPWKWTDWKISPYASWEMYIEDEPSLSTGEMFNKSRSIMGLSMHPAKNLHVSLFYLLLHERHGDLGWQPLHVPGIEIKFEF
ncbi:MAG: DUF2490 domain-containing protein [Kiritimatiellae bacterium]|nr:DUF2490 domain-containing protein [Kiritimatiellia bacterium]